MSEEQPISSASHSVSIRLHTVRVWFSPNGLLIKEDIKRKGLEDVVFDAIVLPEFSTQHPSQDSGVAKSAVLVDFAVLETGISRVLRKYGIIKFVPLSNDDPIVLQQPTEDLDSKKALCYQRLHSTTRTDLMHCLTSVSLQSLFPDWVQNFWISEGEQSREGLEQIIPNAASPYTRPEPAAYQLQDTEVKKPRTIYNSNQKKKQRVSRVGSFNGNSTNRPRNVSITPDDSTDHTIILLPHIPPNIQLIKGRIIDVGARNVDYFDESSPTFEKAILNKVSNISRADGAPEGLSLAPFNSQVH